MFTHWDTHSSVYIFHMISWLAVAVGLFFATRKGRK